MHNTAVRRRVVYGFLTTKICLITHNIRVDMQSCLHLDHFDDFAAEARLLLPSKANHSAPALSTLHLVRQLRL